LTCTLLEAPSQATFESARHAPCRLNANAGVTCCHQSIQVLKEPSTTVTMFAKLSALVSSAPSFPYQIGEPYRTAWGGWKHFKGTSNSDGSAVSIFRTSSTNKQDPKLTSARNGVKRLRTVSIHAQSTFQSLITNSVAILLQLRHPNVLSFKDTAELGERGETIIYLVTEPVTPLLDVLQTLDMSGSARYAQHQGQSPIKVYMLSMCWLHSNTSKTCLDMQARVCGHGPVSHCQGSQFHQQ